MASLGVKKIDEVDAGRKTNENNHHHPLLCPPSLPSPKQSNIEGRKENKGRILILVRCQQVGSCGNEKSRLSHMGNTGTEQKCFIWKKAEVYIPTYFMYLLDCLVF